ncbi:MAG TPA: restriction endonuclease subunit S [Alistipes sp.]|uniref:restriction endonuclease subunit S n=1 Tax=Alistipes sp. TaxID=1872444 RepID=UPI002BD77CBC|nr:restriction endonuclease subunit S [Alistipes sp.]HUN15096.1 restriction endonuclease subunit S [Alistipes sp.]
MDWVKYKLSDVVQFNPAERLAKGTIAKKVAMEQLQPFTRAISGYELAAYSGGSKFRNGDTLMARITPCLENGKTAYVSILDDEEVGFGSTEYIVFRNIEGVTDRKFIYYFVSNPWFRNIAIKSMVGSSGRQRVQQSVLENLEINLPPLAEQKRIAAILGALDDKIELNRRINANLEEQAKALFKSWFVDFEPFKDAGFVDSELGSIPKGWSVGNVNDIVQILSGFAFKSETFAQIGPYQLITIKGVQDGYLDINGASYISKVPLKMPAYCNLGIGDILLSLTGNIGRVCIVDRPNLLLNQRVAKLKLQNGNQDSLFVYILFRQDAFKNHLLQIARGTAQLNLSPVETSKMKIILPPADILLKFSQIGQYLFDEIVHNHQETLHLSTLRDTLLPRLMTGEIPVMDNVINEL